MNSGFVLAHELVMSPVKLTQLIHRLSQHQKVFMIVIQTYICSIKVYLKTITLKKASLWVTPKIIFFVIKMNILRIRVPQNMFV